MQTAEGRGPGRRAPLNKQQQNSGSKYSARPPGSATTTAAELCAALQALLDGENATLGGHIFRGDSFGFRQPVLPELLRRLRRLGVRVL